MDRIESLGNTISNLTMYDIKSMYTQVRFILLNARPCYPSGLGADVLMHDDGCAIGEKRGVQR
jgi:hypothetical protein